MKAGIYVTHNELIYVRKDRSVAGVIDFHGRSKALAVQSGSDPDLRVKTSEKERLAECPAWFMGQAERYCDVPNGCTGPWTPLDAALKDYLDRNPDMTPRQGVPMVDVQKERLELSGVTSKEQARNLANYIHARPGRVYVKKSDGSKAMIGTAKFLTVTSGHVDAVPNDGRRFVVIHKTREVGKSESLTHVDMAKIERHVIAALEPKNPPFDPAVYTKSYTTSEDTEFRGLMNQMVRQSMHREWREQALHLEMMRDAGIIDLHQDSVTVLDPERYNRSMAEYKSARREETQRALSAPYGSPMTPADNSPTTTIYVDASDAQEVRDMVHRHLPHASVHNARMVDLHGRHGSALHSQFKKIGLHSVTAPRPSEIGLMKRVSAGSAWTCNKQSARKHRKAGHHVERLGHAYVWWRK